MTTRAGERVETSWSNVRLPDDTRIGIGLDARERKRVEAEGTDGLARALALCPDAVIVDIGLPGLDGYAIARRLRDAGPPGALLVAITGYGQDGDRRRSREAGFDVHLTKPIDPRVLDALLANTGA